METAFRTDFSGVRVHIAPEIASMGALAVTHGSDLFFAPGQYMPGSPHGQRLIAHELAHVVQQRAGRVRNPLGHGTALVHDPLFEAEAERMAALAGTAAPPPISTPSTVQRRPAPTATGVVQCGWLYHNQHKYAIKVARGKDTPPPPGYLIFTKEKKIQEILKEIPNGWTSRPTITYSKELEEQIKAHGKKKGGGGGALKRHRGFRKLSHAPTSYSPKRKDRWSKHMKKKDSGFDEPTSIRQSPGHTHYAMSPGGSEYPQTAELGGQLIFDDVAEINTFGSFLLGFGTPSLPKLVKKTLAVCGVKKSANGVEITPKIVASWGGKREEEETSQIQAMSGWSAREAAAAAGYPLPGSDKDPLKGYNWNWQWLHLIAYTMGGQDGLNPNVAGNLVAGTSLANGSMELVEALVKEAVSYTKTTLLIDVSANIVNTSYHVCDELEYVVKRKDDPSKLIRYNFKCLSLLGSFGGDKAVHRPYFYAKLELDIPKTWAF
jgi:hypothetical protein